MNLAFLSYWGIDEGLTKSTVLPHIEILSSFEKISKIYLFTIERGDFEHRAADNPKVQHVPLISQHKQFRIFNKISDFVRFPEQIKAHFKTHNIDLLICRGAPAGAIGLLALKKSKIPFIVESFEPHAEYMLESGVWSKNGLSYKLEKKWEKETIRKAHQIFTVSNAYRIEIQNSVSQKNKFYTVPCAVDPGKFKFSKEARELKRNELNIPNNATTGIYVGKFGGLYLELKNAFSLFNSFLKRHALNKIIILSPDDHKQIRLECEYYKITEDRVIIKSVSHENVHQYLSAADFAFAIYKPGKSKYALSPIKIGEYWANGLPVLVPAGIGDDSDIIFINKIGSELIMDDFDHSLSEFLQLIGTKTREEWAEHIKPFALKYRSFSKVREVYYEII
jgi:hypothetical protein